MSKVFRLWALGTRLSRESFVGQTDRHPGTKRPKKLPILILQKIEETKILLNSELKILEIQATTTKQKIYIL